MKTFKTQKGAEFYLKAMQLDTDKNTVELGNNGSYVVKYCEPDANCISNTQTTVLSDGTLLETTEESCYKNPFEMGNYDNFIELVRLLAREGFINIMSYGSYGSIEQGNKLSEFSGELLHNALNEVFKSLETSGVIIDANYVPNAVEVQTIIKEKVVNVYHNPKTPDYGTLLDKKGKELFEELFRQGLVVQEHFGCHFHDEFMKLINDELHYQLTNAVWDSLLKSVVSEYVKNAEEQKRLSFIPNFFRSFLDGKRWLKENPTFEIVQTPVMYQRKYPQHYKQFVAVEKK